jgi:hypothetical protein
MSTVTQVFPGLPAIVRSDDHHYSFLGQTYPGVTGILKILDKSGPLMAWASKETAKAAIAMLKTGALSDLVIEVGDEAAIKALTAKAGWERDEAAKVGTRIHAMADAHVRGEVGADEGQDIAKRVELYAEWWQGSGWTLRLSEALVVHTAVRYGGTFDLLARGPDGETILADIKTGKGIYTDAALQLAAYGMAEWVCPMGSPTAYPMPKVDRYVILHVTEKGVREVDVKVGSAEQVAFIAACALAKWRDQTKGRRL